LSWIRRLSVRSFGEFFIFSKDLLGVYASTRIVEDFSGSIQTVYWCFANSGAAYTMVLHEERLRKRLNNSIMIVLLDA
jgi:hypothetical protein